MNKLKLASVQQIASARCLVEIQNMEKSPGQHAAPVDKRIHTTKKNQWIALLQFFSGDPFGLKPETPSDSRLTVAVQGGSVYWFIPRLNKSSHPHMVARYEGRVDCDCTHCEKGLPGDCVNKMAVKVVIDAGLVPADLVDDPPSDSGSDQAPDQDIIRRRIEEVAGGPSLDFREVFAPTVTQQDRNRIAMRGNSNLLSPIPFG